MTTPGWQSASRILVIRLDALGDVLMTTPAIAALRESATGRRITLLTSPAGAALAPLVPEIDDVLVFEAPWMKATAPGNSRGVILAMAERLRAEGFDGAVIFTVYSQSPLPAAMLCLLAEIPRRLAHCRENPYQLLTDWVPESEPERQVRHEVRRQLDLVAAVGATTADERLRLRIPAERLERARAAVRAAGIEPNRPWVALHPGASAPSRRYPPEQFATAARRLVCDAGMSVLVLGGESDRLLVEQVRASMGVPSAGIVGGLTLTELAGVIALAPVLIANNSAPAHVAAAVGTPVVDVYALTNPQHTPWAVPCRVLSFDVPCRNCYKSVCPEGHNDCIRQVRPEDVAAAALSVLAERPAHRVATV